MASQQTKSQCTCESLLTALTQGHATMQAMMLAAETTDPSSLAAAQADAVRKMKVAAHARANDPQFLRAMKLAGRDFHEAHANNPKFPRVMKLAARAAPELMACAFLWDLDLLARAMGKHPKFHEFCSLGRVGYDSHELSVINPKLARMNRVKSTKGREDEVQSTKAEPTAEELAKAEVEAEVLLAQLTAAHKQAVNNPEVGSTIVQNPGRVWLHINVGADCAMSKEALATLAAAARKNSYLVVWGFLWSRRFSEMIKRGALSYKDYKNYFVTLQGLPPGYTNQQLSESVRRDMDALQPLTQRMPRIWVVDTRWACSEAQSDAKLDVDALVRRPGNPDE